MLACVTGAGGLFPRCSFFPLLIALSVYVSGYAAKRYGALYLCNDMISSNLSSASAVSFGSEYNFVVILLLLIHKNCHKISLVAAPLLILGARGCISVIFVKSVLWGIDFCFSGNTPSGNLILSSCQIAGWKWVSSVVAGGALEYHEHGLEVKMLFKSVSALWIEGLICAVLQRFFRTPH